jgi:nitrous oxidase accessory protein
MRIKNFDLGISLDNSSESKIVRSIIVSNTTGIQLNRSNYFELVSNIVKNSHTYSFGLRVRFIEAGNSVAIIPIAIRLNKVRNTKITFNNLKENNFIGTFLSHSNGNRVIGNEIWENGYGMCLHFSSENEVFRNNFIRNKKQVFCRNSVNVWNSTRKVVIYHTPVHLGNYWSDYTGHDENDDGVGDVPYVIDKENKDEFPSIDSFTMGIPLDSE